MPIPHTHKWILQRTVKDKDGNVTYFYKCFCGQTTVTNSPL